MKRIVIIAVLLVAGFSIAAAHTHGAGVSVSLGVFYSSLGIHGDWIFLGGDVYAWRPHRVRFGWRPYWDGRWVWTDDGWFWASDEPWAWAVYHYGRWLYDDYYGWIWVPGYEWAPAWVEWRYGPDYVGWAPLGPYAVFSATVGLYYSVSWVTPHLYWTFVPCHAMLHTGIYRYAYPVEHNARWIGASRGAGAVIYERGRVRTQGPERTFVERQGGLRVTRTDVVEIDRLRGDRTAHANGRDVIEVYRPRIERREHDPVQVRPERFVSPERTLSISTTRIDGRYRIDPVERHRADEGIVTPSRREDRSADRPRVQGQVSRPQESGLRREAEVRRQNEPAGGNSGDRTQEARRARESSVRPQESVRPHRIEPGRAPSSNHSDEVRAGRETRPAQRDGQAPQPESRRRDR